MMQTTQLTTGPRRAIDLFAAGVVFALLALAIGTVGWIYIQSQTADARKAAQDQLATIADMKVREIAGWYRERQADAEVVRDSPLFANHIEQLLANPNRDRTRQQLQTWMDTLQRVQRFHDVVLFNAQGSALLWAAPGVHSSESPSVSRNEHFQAAILAKDVLTTDLHPSQVDPRFIHFSVWVPIGIKPAANVPADAVLRLRIDARESLFPMIQSWPTPSRTAEIVLLRREGNDAVFLNELRHGANAAMDVRMPINTAKRVPATMAVTGREGIEEGMDYRQVPVLAAMRQVPGTPWSIVAKVDQEEVYAGLRQRTWTSGMIVLLAIMAVALGVGLIWRQHENRWLQGEIAERGRAEQAVRASEATQTAVLDNIPDPAWLKDLDGHYLAVNEAWCRFMGLNRANVMGRTDRELRPAELTERIYDEDSKVIASKARYHSEHLIRNTNGALVWFDTFKSPAFDAQGNVVGTVGIARDVTDRKQVEHVLRNTSERLQLATASAKLGVWEWDPTTGTVVWDGLMFEIYGIRRESFRGCIEDWRNCLHPDDVAMAMEENKAAVDGRKAYDTEFRIVRPDGTVRRIKADAVMIRDADGKPVRQIGVNRDVTEQRQAESTRDASIELLAICNQARGQRDLLESLTGYFQRFTGCEAVGVRLREGEDWPYYETRGFPAEFVRAENRLCVLDPTGQPVRDSGGNPVLECMCGNILRGRFDPAKPFFTKHGSFWTNCTTQLLASTTDADRQARTRNRCNGEGYESVALVPILAYGRTLGLLQCNSRQTGRFTLERIELIEQLANYVAIAIAKLQADEALRASEEHYRSLFENMLNGFAYCRMIYDQGRPQDFVYLEVNAAFESWTGLKNVVGKRVSELVPGIQESDRELLDIYGRVAMTGRPERFERYVEALHMWFAVSVYSPKKEHFAAVFDVVTERKQAEAAVRRSEEELDSIFENAPVAMLLVDAGQRVRKANRTAAGLAGLDPAEMIGKHACQALGCAGKGNGSGGCGTGPECVDCAVPRALMDTFETGQAYAQLEATLAVVRGETVRQVSLVVSTTLMLAGAERMVLMCVEDITERKRLEAQLLQAQKMEAIGRLAGGIAHDFRNQLTVVKGYSEMLLRMSLIKDGKENLVGEILNAAHRGAQLTGQLLAFSRKDMLQPSLEHLDRLVAELAGPMSRLVGEDIVFATTGGGADLTVDIAAAQFEHAMMNLATNARDAMPHGGTLTIDTASVEIDGEMATQLQDAKPGHYVRVTVRDSGAGMDRATQARLFEPFFTTKKRGQGTGLGLPMVYGFVRQSGGFITVNSQPGAGASFALHFPHASAETGAESQVAAKVDARRGTSLPKGTETVLVVEDEEPIRWLVTQCLRESGYTVIETGDAPQAIEAAGKSGAAIDLLITDVVMPGMSGVELAKQARGRWPDVPVLFVSGYGSDDLSQRGVDLDRAELLIKPFQHSKMVQIVRRLLDERQSVE